MDNDKLIDNLIYKYLSGNLVPVLGCELFKVEPRNRKPVNIHEYLISESFVPNSEWPETPKLLSELPLANTDFDRSSLLGCYKLIKEQQKKLDLLSKISSMKNFNVFIVATVFKEFEYEFKKNNKGEEVEIYKNTTISPHGLPEIDFENNKRKIIYLFDNVDSPLCAINDEQLLESVYSLSNTPKHGADKSLLSFLQDKTLLFIGCDFPDWFMRYCIRVLYNKPFEKRPTYIINDNPPKINYQESFFKKHNIQLVQSSPVSDFVNMFHQKAALKEDFNNQFLDSQVFICYSIDHDKDVSKDLNDYLYTSGIDTYFDENNKEIGGHQDKIQKYIFDKKTKVLISVISKGMLDNMSGSSDHYIRDVEWYAAFTKIDANKMSNTLDKFCVVPYFTDNEREYIDRLPDHINSEFRFGNHHGGFEELYRTIKNFLS